MKRVCEFDKGGRRVRIDQGHEDVRKRAHQSAKRQGYCDIDEYFAERGNQRIDVIARELKIPKTRVGSLREEYLNLASLSVQHLLLGGSAISEATYCQGSTQIRKSALNMVAHMRSSNG